MQNVEQEPVAGGPAGVADTPAGVDLGELVNAAQDGLMPVVVATGRAC